MAPKQKAQSEMAGWGRILLDTALGGVTTFIGNVVETVEGVTKGLLRDAAIHFTLLVAFLCGAMFLLTGVALWAGSRFDFPGAGQMIVGVVLLIIAGIATAFFRQGASTR